MPCASAFWCGTVKQENGFACVILVDTGGFQSFFISWTSEWARRKVSAGIELWLRANDVLALFRACVPRGWHS